MFFEGIKTLMQKESEFFANHQNLVREINNLAKKALSTNPKDITYDILRKNRDKAIDLMKKMNSSDSPVAKLYNLVPEPNVYMQATTNFKGPNTIKVIGVKIENDNVSLVESSFTSKGALPSDNKVIKELNVGDLIKNSDDIRNGIRNNRNMFKQIVKEAKEESDKYNKQVNLESLSKEAKELYVKTLKENASNMNYLTKVGNGGTSLLINLVRFIAVCTKKIQAQ
jgi:MFS superfamily sulfate permease-like transporter